MWYLSCLNKKGLLFGTLMISFPYGLIAIKQSAIKSPAASTCSRTMKRTNNTVFARVVPHMIVYRLWINLQTVTCCCFHCPRVKLKPCTTDVPVTQFLEKQTKSTSYFQNVISLCDVFI